jgi:hypothetical protein
MSAKSEAMTLEAPARMRPRVRLSEQRPDQDALVIGTLYRKGREAMLDSVKYSLQAGRKLIQKKASMPHGKWGPWLRANADLLGFKHRTTASRLMKTAASNDASTHHLSEAEAIRINRKLWGNLDAATRREAELKEVKLKEKRSPTKRSATDIADCCIEMVRATIEETITDLRRAHAPRAKFELLFEALGEVLVDVQRKTLDADNDVHRPIRRGDRDRAAGRGGNRVS